MSSFAEVEAASARGDHAAVLSLTDAILAERPGDDAAHELRARSLLALGRHEEAEEHAQAAVRLDPEEIRYRELLAEVLSATGAHRDAAAEYGRLARNDPRQTAWLIAEAGEHLEAAQAGQGIEAARAAVRLDPRSGHAQLTLAQALVRVGDARGAYQAAGAALRLLGGSPEARETLADAQWLAGERRQALDGVPRSRCVARWRPARSRAAQGAGTLCPGCRMARALAGGRPAAVRPRPASRLAAHRSVTDVDVARTAELDAATMAELDRLCTAAFDEPWDGYWERIGPAVHVLVRDGGTLVAHACYVERDLVAGTLDLRAAYVEAVAVDPQRQGSGLGSVAMRRLGELIVDGYPLGALATGSNAFYERLGWETWRGEIWLGEHGGRRRMPEQEGDIMILRTPTTPSTLDTAAPLGGVGSSGGSVVSGSIER